MSYHFVVGLLNPAMAAIFGASLLALWSHQRQLSYVAIFGLSYAVRLLCFGALYFAFVQDNLVLRLLSNSLILLATMLMSIALSRRFGYRPRYEALSIIGVISLAGLCFYLLVQPDLAARAYILNGGLAAVCLVMLFDIARRPDRTPVEQLLFGLMGLVFCIFVLRPLVFSLPASATGRLEDTYWLVVSISDALICSILAVAIFSIIAVDVMDSIKTEAQIDVLSGLFNRRGFEARAFNTLARQTTAAPAAIILSDLDHFKSINDRFGHVSGDRVIQAFSEVLRANSPLDAIVGRMGGEEFAVLLPPGRASAAHHLAETLRSAFKEVAPCLVSNEFRPSASFGIAIARADENLLALMERADLALYQAKNDGRDCIRQSG